MPETQSRCEFKRNSIDVGLGAAGKQLEQVLLAQVCCLPSSLSLIPFFVIPAVVLSVPVCVTLRSELYEGFLIFWLKINTERISWQC